MPLTRSWTSKALINGFPVPIQGAPTQSTSFLHPGWFCCFPMSLLTGFAVFMAIQKGLEKSIQRWPLLRFTEMCLQIASPKCFPTVSSSRKCWRVLGRSLFLTPNFFSQGAFTVAYIDPLCLLTWMSSGTASNSRKSTGLGQFGTSWQIPYALTIPPLDYNHPCVISYPSHICPQVAPRDVLQAQGFSVIAVGVGMGTGMCPLSWFSTTVQFWLLPARAKNHLMSICNWSHI